MLAICANIFRDLVGRATITQSILGISAPSVRTAITTAQQRTLDGVGRGHTAVDQHGILSSSKSLYQCFALNNRSVRMKVPCIDPRIAKRGGQCDDMRDVHAEH